MTSKQIIGAIMLITGDTPEALGKKYGISKSSIYRVINGSFKTRSVRAVISKETGLMIKELWPTDG